MAAALLVILTAPWKPLPHWLVTEYSTEQAGAAPDAETTGTVTAPTRATAPQRLRVLNAGVSHERLLADQRAVTDASTDGIAPTGVKEGSAK